MNFSKFTKITPFKVFSKTHFQKETVQSGTFIMYQETDTNNNTHQRLGRVLEKVVRFADGGVPLAKELWVSVVVPNEEFRFGYIRYIKREDITDVLTEQQVFMKWFVNFKEFDTSVVQGLQNYGALSNRYMSEHLTKEGEIDRFWREKKMTSEYGYYLLCVMPIERPISRVNNMSVHRVLDFEEIPGFKVVFWHYQDRDNAHRDLTRLDKEGYRVGLEMKYQDKEENLKRAAQELLENMRNE